MKILTALIAIAFAATLGAAWADEPMTKIVFRAVEPEMPAEAFAAKPKTLYLWTATRMRTEEMPDPAMKLQGLVIANGKDIWMINLWDKTGRHIIDPGPTYNAHAPIVPPDGQGKPTRAADFEMGREMAYMTAHHAQQPKGLLDGVERIIYEATQDGLKLRLYVAEDTQLPVGVSVDEGDRRLLRMTYDFYSTNLPADPALFQPPPGIQITEAKPGG